MSLLVCKWKREFGPEVKEAIRKDICAGMGTLTGVDPRYFAVCFEDYEEVDFSNQGIGVFVLVYQTEGRDDTFKDRLVTLITDTFCKYTNWDASRVSIMIHDIQRGSMGHNGVIVNRSGAVANTIANQIAGDTSERR